MSPRKVREVARVIQGRPASEAMDLVRFIPRKSARLIAKNLIVAKAIVEQGPVLKRFKASARGSASPRKKRMSHIRIVLSDKAGSN